MVRRAGGSARTDAVRAFGHTGRRKAGLPWRKEIAQVRQPCPAPYRHGIHTAAVSHGPAETPRARRLRLRAPNGMRPDASMSLPDPHPTSDGTASAASGPEPTSILLCRSGRPCHLQSVCLFLPTKAFAIVKIKVRLYICIIQFTERHQINRLRETFFTASVPARRSGIGTCGVAGRRTHLPEKRGCCRMCGRRPADDA